MKREYKKPVVVFENFSLSTNVASCGFEATFDASLGKWGCKAYMLRSGEVIFMEAFSGCTTVEASGNYNGYCYHVPLVSLNLFGS